MLFFFKKDFIYFKQRGREGERGGEKHQCVVASCMPLTGDLTWPATQACALTRNGACNPWFAGQCSIHWATSARAPISISKSSTLEYLMKVRRTSQLCRKTKERENCNKYQIGSYEFWTLTARVSVTCVTSDVF